MFLNGFEKVFLSKVNIWNAICVRATAFISTHKHFCESFWDRKYLDLRWLEPQTFGVKDILNK